MPIGFKIVDPFTCTRFRNCDNWNNNRYRSYIIGFGIINEFRVTELVDAASAKTVKQIKADNIREIADIYAADRSTVRISQQLDGGLAIGQALFSLMAAKFVICT